MGCMAQDAPLATAASARHPLLACTMDFLDFVFHDMEGSPAATWKNDAIFS